MLQTNQNESPVAGEVLQMPLLLVVEGANDIDFLVRIATQLRKESNEIPDLAALAREQRIVLLPLGGGDASSWPRRYAPLGHPEFHLYDREQDGEVAARQRAADEVNRRSGCRAFVTRKRSLENYLHPAVIAACGDGMVHFGDDDSVAQIVARQRRRMCGNEDWATLPWRKRKQLIQQVKRRLNTVAVEQMNSRLLAERDPTGEVRGWLRAISEMIRA